MRVVVAVALAFLLTPGVVRAWDLPVTVVDEGEPVLEDVAFRGEDDAIAIWLGRTGETGVWASRYQDGRWDSGVPLYDGPDSALFARLADDGKGRTFAVYAVESYPFGYQLVTVSAREFDGEDWSPPTRLGNGSAVVGGLMLAAGPDGTAMAVSAASEWYGTYSLWAARYDPSLGWTEADSLGFTNGFADAAVDEAGRAVVAWSRQDEGFEGLWAARFVDGGWTPPEQVDSGTVQMVRVEMAGGRALAAWTQVGEFGSRVMRSLRDPVTGWSTAEPLSFGPEIDDDRVSGASLEIATSPSGDGVAVFWLSLSTESSLWTAEIEDLGFDTPRRMAASGDAGVSIAVNLRGDAAMAWVNGSGLVAQARPVSQRWCQVNVFDLSGDGGHFASSEVRVDEAGGVLLTWGEFDGTEFIIRSSHHDIDPSCDASGPSAGESAVLTWGVVALSIGAAVSVVFLLRRYRRKGEKA